MEIDDDAIWQYTLKPLPLSQLRPANPREQLHWYPEVVSRQFPPFRQFVCPHVTTKRQHFPLVLEITFIGVPLYFVCRIKVSFDSWLCHEWKIYMMHATLLISKHVSIQIKFSSVTILVYLSKYQLKKFVLKYFNKI